jgi:hypothetical protein
METGVTFTDIPQLSAEARELMGLCDPVDLRPLLALECEPGSAVIKAAESWGMDPDRILP